jgi:hypothetical protein
LFGGDFHFKTKALKISLAILHFALIFYGVYALGKKWTVGFDKLFWSAFLIRLAAGISLGLIYIYYYPAGDTWSFFYDAKVFSGLARHDFYAYLKAIFDVSENPVIINEMANQDPRSIFFIKIISVFSLLSLDNYWVCTAYFSLLSFVSAWALHRKVVNIFPDAQKASSLAFLFFPSVVFWSSGLEKETIALCGIYFLTIGFLSLVTSAKPHPSFWWLILPVCYAVWGLKYYWAVILFISFSTALIIRLLMSKSLVVKKYWMGVWVALFFGIGMLLSFSHPNFYFDQFLEMVISNYDDFAAISDPNNLIHYFHLHATWTSLLMNSPWALLSGLFRPVIGEGHGLMGLFASIENLLVLVLFLGAVRNMKKALISSDQIILMAALSYCIVLCVFLALSTPNFGTLSRYRTGFLPFFVFVFAYRNPIVEWVSNKMGVSFGFN